jgi:hypothetical protein
LDSLLAIPLLKKPLAEPFQGVQKPCENPSVDSSLNYRTQRVLFFFCACLHTDSIPSRQSFFSLPTERSTVMSSLVHLAPTRCPPGRALRILSDSGSSFELTIDFFLCALLAPTQCPPGRASQNSSKLLSKLTAEFLLQCTTVPTLYAHLAELYRIHKRILFATVSLIHSLASKVFNNLEVFFL